MRSVEGAHHARIGIGYDVHQFAARRRFILGGVRIPSTKGLLGHSDADVLLHAICDALLGATALGDIGVHFPNTSRRYKGISSLVLLTHVGELLSARGFMVMNVDSTIVLESPKVMRYAPRMARNIARALGVRPSQVSIKATTNEGLGFLGRGEGCAALAIAAVVPTRM